MPLMDTLRALVGLEPLTKEASEAKEAEVMASVELQARPGEVLRDPESGKERKVRAIVITEAGVEYKTTGEHELDYLEEDEFEVRFACRHCDAVIGFVKPGLGEPVVHGKPVAWEPHPDFALYMSDCGG